MSRRRHARQAREVDHVHRPIPLAGLFEQLLEVLVAADLVVLTAKLVEGMRLGARLEDIARDDAIDP